ncbi:MAG TPA: hypothetical protein DE315_03695 [Candidatus Omnitrophica bacterium]|nr:hypothetical protein [Candidatus Omnitrophota bacterium]HCI44619.1 hypothetical protein [Candidatus Omnitrophota bacterium]
MSFLKDYPQLQMIRDIARRRKVAVHLVGGFLRDYMTAADHMGSAALNPTRFRDFDFAVEKGALDFARLFARRVKGAYVVLDEERGCARVVHRISKRNSVRSRQKSEISGGSKKAKQIWTFDFADFRARNFQKDLTLRDFTINTLSADLAKFDGSTKLEDVLAEGQGGLKDLRARRIRRVSAKAFRDDPLRLLRAFSLSATLDFKIDPQTLAQIRREKNLLRGVSYERIRDEIFKILESGRAAVTLKAMDKAGLLDKVIPQVKVMYHCAQKGTYHHLDVWPHSLEVVAQFDGVVREMQNNADAVEYLNEPLGGNRTRRALLKLAALLHDIGKPETRKEAGQGKLTFYGHERVGKNIVTHIAKMLKLSTGERRALEDMVFWHLRPGYLSNFQKPSDKAIYRYLRDARREAAGILLLSLADQRATRGPSSTPRHERHHERICLDVLKLYFDKKKEKPFVRLIDGHDLIKQLRLKPSPLIGKILTEVTEQQVLGKIKTKKEALELAKDIAQT